MKKTFLAAIRHPLALLRRLSLISPRSRKEKFAQDQEDERIDRIRNPHKYYPTQDD